MRLAAAILAFGVAACASPGSHFPMVAPSTPQDAALDCAAMGAELSRVAALRVEIARERGELNRSDTGYVALDALLFPPFLLIGGPLTAIGADQRNDRFDAAATAAEARLGALLAARSARACAGPEAERELAAALSGAPPADAAARRARSEAIAAYLTQD